ncbi:hypothetical protein TrCOL_g7536 [Triparma columacea]|nr:hypothetical protein TrCOL_g7536 [Triparma columacea]
MPGDVIEKDDTICDVEINFDPKEVFESHEMKPVVDAEGFLDEEYDTGDDKDGSKGEKMGYGGSDVGSSESIVFGMDCEEEGVMGEHFLKSFEQGCTLEEYEKWEKGGNVICEIFCYEEDGWREKYGNHGGGDVGEEEGEDKSKL